MNHATFRSMGVLLAIEACCLPLGTSIHTITRQPGARQMQLDHACDEPGFPGHRLLARARPVIESRICMADGGSEYTSFPLWLDTNIPPTHPRHFSDRPTTVVLSILIRRSSTFEADQ